MSTNLASVVQDANFFPYWLNEALLVMILHWRCLRVLKNPHHLDFSLSQILNPSELAELKKNISSNIEELGVYTEVLFLTTNLFSLHSVIHSFTSCSCGVVLRNLIL